jgi:hypothetical protein
MPFQKSWSLLNEARSTSSCSTVEGRLEAPLALMLQQELEAVGAREDFLVNDETACDP